MEDFIQEIYNDANIIEELKEYISLTYAGRSRDARSVYDHAVGQLEQLLLRIAPTDAYRANKLQDSALTVKEAFDDYSHATGLVQSELLPKLYEHISNYTGIEVNSGKYLLKSSNTGFLTVRDNEYNCFLHDIYDPMWQAYQIVKSEFRPQTDCFLVFGCGLGYLPYQIWHQSEGAVKIYVFEEDETILDYALRYGVLSLIPDNLIEIVHNNKEILAKSYIDMINTMDLHDSYYISPWKKSIYEHCINGELNRITLNRNLYSEMKDRSLVNLYKNKQISGIRFEDIADRFQYDEWIVVSAGPSFDDNISFLKKHDKGIIAVNTVLRRLSKEEIIPDIAVAADQYVQMADHITGLEYYTSKIALIADRLTNWQYINRFRGPICFVSTNANTVASEAYLIDEPSWDVNGTVACLAIEAAVRLGAKKIYLVGQDLAYPDGRKYAKGMPHEEANDAKWTMQVPSTDGKMVYTCEAFNWFRKSIEYQISKYPDVVFINLSQHGAYIKGTIQN